MAVEKAFGSCIDYAQLVKYYGMTTTEEQRRYSPAGFVSAEKHVFSGAPDMDKVSTSYVDRQNLTMRMHMRRFTSLTNRFSKKLANHIHAVSLHFMFYNFCKIHKTLRVTPAMGAGIADHVWSLEEVIEMMDTNN